MAYINARAAKKAIRKPAGLTVTKATADARKLVNRHMPNVGATVDSRLSHDMKNDVPTVITTITFPTDAPSVTELFNDLAALSDRHGWNAVATNSIVITRKR